MEMGRLTAFRKRCWTQAEDELLKKYVDKFSEGNWKHIPSKSGLNRCRKSCRLRYMNYLRPNIKRGSFALDEDDLIIRLHRLLGNRWTLIAGRIPGRTANDIKNYWNSYLSKKSSSSLENNNQTYHHHHHTSNIYLKPSEGDFESLSTGHEQDGEEEEEQDITSFWKRLLLEVDYLENKLGVDNKEMKTKDDELFQGLEDFPHDIEIEGGSG